MADPDPAPPAPPGGPPADPAAARLDKIETEQAEQRGMLDKILALVGGGKADPVQGDPPPAPAATAEGIREQVRREIAEADQRRKAEETDAQWRAGVTEVVERVRAEQAPREPESGIRGFLQRGLVGRQP